MTGTTAITLAMNHLGLLAQGAAPNSSQLTWGLDVLNKMLAGWQAQYIGGVTIATSGAAKTITSTTIATYATTGTDNTYPTGWDVAIAFNLAIDLAGSYGVKPPDWVVARATETKRAISQAGEANAAGA